MWLIISYSSFEKFDVLKYESAMLQNSYTDISCCNYVLFTAVLDQLKEYEQQIFEPVDNSNTLQPGVISNVVPSFSFGLPRANDPGPVPVPTFSTSFGAPSIFAHPPNTPPQEFTFGAGQTTVSGTTFGGNVTNPNGGDISMDNS